MLHQVALKEELHRTDNVYKHVAMQEAEERRLRDQELKRMRLEWLEQMKVQCLRPYITGTLNIIERGVGSSVHLYGAITVCSDIAYCSLAQSGVCRLKWLLTFFGGIGLDGGAVIITLLLLLCTTAIARCGRCGSCSFVRLALFGLRRWYSRSAIRLQIMNSKTKT